MYAQSMFWSKNKTKMYTLVNTSFLQKKWGVRGCTCTLHGHVSIMQSSQSRIVNGQFRAELAEASTKEYIHT